MPGKILNLLHIQCTMKKKYDKNINFQEYEVGDSVWRHDPTKKKELSEIT